MKAMMETLGAEHGEREQRPETRRRQRRKDRQRVGKALVEHPEHDIDGDQRRDDQVTSWAEELSRNARMSPAKSARTVSGISQAPRPPA